MSELYYFHGSRSSVDYDIFVVVETPLNWDIQDLHTLCSQYEEELSKIYTDKPVNVNLISIAMGQVQWCFKGTIDEVNNGLLYTYDLHEQVYPQPIKQRYPRAFELKAIRAVRIILSALSRTGHRYRIKEALKGDIMHQLTVLEEIDLTKIDSFNKKYPDEDYIKTIAFQIGQVFGLINNTELYTKEDIGVLSSYLTPYLNRVKDADRTMLEFYKGVLVSILKDRNWKRTHE